jgi:C4-type Zn-finger protein
MDIIENIIAKRATCIVCGKIYGNEPEFDQEFYTTSKCDKVVASSFVCERCGSNVFNVELDIDVNVGNLVVSQEFPF